MINAEFRTLTAGPTPHLQRTLPLPGQGVRPVATVLAHLSPAWNESLLLVEQHLPFRRRMLHAGDVVQVVGEPFVHLHVVKFGVVKSISQAANGTLQVAGFHLKGDWIGFDCIASGSSVCDAVAMDTSEVWSFSYSSLLQAAPEIPQLMHGLHVAMSCQMARDRDWRFALGTLAADARVADFVRNWASLLAERQLRTDEITLRMTRAEIGNYLGMTLETVSRAFTRLAQLDLIRFEQRGRRHFTIPSVHALMQFVEQTGNTSTGATLQ